MSRVDVGLVTSAVVALLRATVPAEVEIGDGRAPVPGPDDTRRTGPTTTGTRRGYGIVYQVAGGAALGQGYLGEDTAIRAVRFQLVGCGVSRAQAQSVADLMTAVLCDRDDTTRAFVHDLTVAGHAVLDRTEVGDVPQDDEHGIVQMGYLVDVSVQSL
jgi:hypothetical protein